MQYLGDYLSPLVTLIVGVLVFIAAKQKNRSNLRKQSQDHQIHLNEVVDRKEAEWIKRVQNSNQDLWNRLIMLEKTTSNERIELNKRIDTLHKEIGACRDYANKLRGQLIEADIVPAPWPVR